MHPTLELMELILKNAHCMRWAEDALGVALLNPPEGVADHLQLLVVSFKLDCNIAVFSGNELVRLLNANADAVPGTVNDFLAACRQNSSLKLVASWRRLTLEESIDPTVVAALGRGSYLAVWRGLPELEALSLSESIEYVRSSLPADLLGGIAWESSTAAFVAFQTHAKPLEVMLAKGAEGAIRTANLPLIYGPRQRAGAYQSVYSAVEFYESPPVYNQQIPDKLEQFAPYRASFDIGIRRFDSVTYHSPTGSAFEQNGNAIHETTWHILFQENEVAPYFASDATEWRLWRKCDPIISGKLEEAVFLGSVKFSTNYFHWFNDTVPRIWLYMECIRYRLIDENTRLILPRLRPGAFQSTFLDAVGLPRESVRFLEDGFFQLDHAIVPRMRTDESRRFSPHFNGMRLTATPLPFFVWLARMAQRLVDPGIFGPTCIFLSRSDTPKRIIVNEAEVCTYLEKHGFAIVRTGGLTLTEQVSLLRNARVVIGAHGAGLTNFAFARLNAILIEIRNSTNTDNGFRFISQYRDSTYMCFTSNPVPRSDRAEKDYDMHVDMSAFDKFYRETVRPLLPT